MTLPAEITINSTLDYNLLDNITNELDYGKTILSRINSSGIYDPSLPISEEPIITTHLFAQNNTGNIVDLPTDGSGVKLAIAAHPEREHERALDVVQFEKKKEGHAHHVATTVGKEPKQQHGDKHGRLHEYPTQLVVDRWAPFRVVKLAISRIYKEKAHKNNHSHYSHGNQENIISM